MNTSVNDKWGWFIPLLFVLILAGCTQTVLAPANQALSITATATTKPNSLIPTNITNIATPTPTISPTHSSVPTFTRTSTPTPTPTRTKLPFSSGPIRIGNSVAGLPIEVYRFGTGPLKKMIIAGIHGGYEWNTIKLAKQLIDHIKADPTIIPESSTLYILPVLNPDGEARGHGAIGRANDHGVDLNRNFPSGWSKEWNPSGCWQLLPINGGAFPLSEPEAKSLAVFLQRHRLEALISYHSAGLGVFPGGEKYHQESISLARAISDVSPFYYPPFETGCEYTGMLADYAADLGIAAVDLELSTHWDTELPANLIVLETFLQWTP